MAAVMQESSTIQVRFNNALCLYPVRRRVIEISALLRECNVKELQTFFPVLIENIFGIKPNIGNTSGWGLHNLVRYASGEDFEALYSFLHPHGVVFEVAYKLLVDLYLKYEFPLTYLPDKFKHSILEGNIPPFYIDKVQVNQHTRLPIALSLNAFEFYMFHFAYHLVNPWQLHSPRPPGAGNETVYLHLSDVYLSNFLPVETSTVLPLVILHQATPLPRSPPPQAHPTKTPKLFKPSIVVKLGAPAVSPPTAPHPHTEIWRSETVVQVAICMWLSFMDEGKTADAFAAFKAEPARSPLDWLPSDDHLRVVRNMVKHLHYFSNNIHNDNSSMDELRKIVLSSCQHPLYLFLRRHIHHWPLDSSFVLILETYLSYIQPWRYTNYSNKVQYTREQMGESNPVDSKWFNFIAENLLAYTVINGELIPRFSRLDLTSPRHAHMLFRMSKVLSQQNLANFLREIESCLEDFNESSFLNSSAYSTPKANSTSVESPIGHVSVPLTHKLNALVRQQILELESPNFQYKPLFSQKFLLQVVDFLGSIQQAIMLVRTLLQSALVQQSHRSSSFVQMVKDFFVGPSVTDDYTIDDRQKTLSYLELSVSLLAEVFGVVPPELPDPNLFNRTVDSNTTNDSNLSNSNFSANNTDRSCKIEPSRLNPKDWMKRAKMLQYEGNPDLQPVRTTEITFLVRFFHQLSCRINEMYGTELSSLWNRNDFWGRVAQQLLSPPSQAFYFDKRVPGNFAPHVSVNLPPRVCLRTFASHQTLAYFFAAAFLPFIFNYPLVPFFGLLLLLYVVIVFVKALLHPFLNRSQFPERHTLFVPLDVSFNE